MTCISPLVTTVLFGQALDTMCLNDPPNGKSLKIGASKLKLSGDGFIENSNDIELNDPLSILELDGLKVSRISFTEEQTDGKLVVTKNSLIKSLSQLVSSQIQIENGINCFKHIY